MIAVFSLIVVMSSPADYFDAIKAEYVKWDRAYLNHDVVALAKILHPEFSLVTGSGARVSRRDYVQRLWKSTMPEVYQTEVSRVEGAPNGLFAFTSETLKIPGQEVRSHEYRDAWVETDAGWMMMESRTVGGH